MVTSGASVTVNLTLATAKFVGQIDGNLVGSGFGASAVGNVPWDGATYVASALDGTVLGKGALIPMQDTTGGPNGVGSAFSVNITGGQMVSLTLLPAPEASTNPCDTFGPFVLPAVPVIQGFATSLGQVTWLNNAALGANGIGPCADGGSPVVDAGSDGGTDAGPLPVGWNDAGQIAWQSDGGVIQQTQIYPILSPEGGYVLAFMAGQIGQTDVYSETVQNGVSALARLTIGGQASPDSLSGAPIDGGVLLTFSTNAGTTTAFSELIVPGTNPQPQTPPFPQSPGLGAEQTTTFSGELAAQPGAFVLQPLTDGDAGVIGSFFSAGTDSFGSAFVLVPGAPETPIEVVTLIGTSCDVADLSGSPGFCLAGSGNANIDGGGPVLVGFISSVSTVSATPTISNTQFLGTYANEPIYEGITTLPNEVAVSVGIQGSPLGINYWELSDLDSAPGEPALAAVSTDLLVTIDGQVLGLTLSGNQGTAGEFLPDGGQIATLQGFVNGLSSNIPAAYADPSSGDLVTAIVPLSYDGTISVLHLVPGP
jgi:hypothetical protein